MKVGFGMSAKTDGFVLWQISEIRNSPSAQLANDEYIVLAETTLVATLSELVLTTCKDFKFSYSRQHHNSAKQAQADS